MRGAPLAEAAWPRAAPSHAAPRSLPAAKDIATTFAPRASGSTGKNQAVKGSLLYEIFVWQGWLSAVAGGLLSFNLLFPSDHPDIARLLGMWSVWMLTVPSWRAREVSLASLGDRVRSADDASGDIANDPLVRHLHLSWGRGLLPVTSQASAVPEECRARFPPDAPCRWGPGRDALHTPTHPWTCGPEIPYLASGRRPRVLWSA